MGIGVILCIIGTFNTARGEIFVEYQRDGVYLQWAKPSCRVSGEPIEAKEILGYNIYRNSGQEDEFKRINYYAVRSAQFIDGQIEFGKNYYYALTTVDKDGLESPRSKTIEALALFFPPQNLTARGEERFVLLNWDKVKDSRLRGYILYRSELPDGKYEKIACIPDTQGEYRDDEVIVGKNYYYKLTSVNLAYQESEPSPIIGATPVFFLPEEANTLEEAVKGLEAVTVCQGGAYAVIIYWGPSTEKNVVGYSIYRRNSKNDIASYIKLKKVALPEETNFTDKKVEYGETYCYSVAAIDKKGHEASYPYERCIPVLCDDDCYITSVTEDSGGYPLKAGDTLTIILQGATGKEAFASLENTMLNIPLIEVENKGLYYGKFTIPKKINQSNISIIAGLKDQTGKECASEVLEGSLTIDNIAPPIIPLIEPAEVTSQMVCMEWYIPGNALKDIDHLALYRSLEDKPGEGDLLGGEISPHETVFCDGSILPEEGYYYSLVTCDKAGNKGVAGNCLFVVTRPDEHPPEIISVKEISKPGTKRAKDAVIIHMIAEAGAEGEFTLGDTGKIEQKFQEIESGLYLAEYTVQEGDDLEAKLLKITLTDAAGNSTGLTTDILITINTKDAVIDPPQIAYFEHNALQLAGNDPLIAKDKLTFYVEGEANCTAFVDLGAEVIRSNKSTEVKLSWDPDLIREKFGQDHPIASYEIYHQLSLFSNLSAITPVDERAGPQFSYEIIDYKGGFWAIAVKNEIGERHLMLTPRLQIPLEEKEPGIYEGIYEIQEGDHLLEAPATAYLVNHKGMISSPVKAADLITIDTNLKISVTCTPETLSADEKSGSDVKIEVKDARENGLAQREIVVDLFTTFDEYSGIVGIGQLGDEKFGYFDNFSRLHTDYQGIINVPYISGFAAKTVIIRAEDINTGDVGLGYITSYIEEEFTFQVFDLPSRARFLGRSKYFLQLWANRSWLTADGVSRAKIYAQVVDAAGLPVLGQAVTFHLEGEGDLFVNGKSGKALTKNTDKSGEAMIEYIAGKRIGTAYIKAKFTSPGGSDCIQEIRIRLKSDAPAKIIFEMDLSKKIYTGGQKRILTLWVKDINDNPNRDIPLQVDLVKGYGQLDNVRERKTSWNGDCELLFTSGSRAGEVTIRARTISRIPNPEILEKIRSNPDEIY